MTLKDYVSRRGNCQNKEFKQNLRNLRILLFSPQETLYQLYRPRQHKKFVVSVHHRLPVQTCLKHTKTELDIRKIKNRLYGVVAWGGAADFLPQMVKTCRVKVENKNSSS